MANIGDWVGFKCDIEQSGRITAIKRNWAGQRVYVLENPNGFIGEYIGGDTTTEELAEDCWEDDANARVRHHAAEISRKIMELQAEVAERIAAAEAGKANWGDVGDLAHWSEQLGYLIGEEE